MEEEAIVNAGSAEQWLCEELSIFSVCAMVVCNLVDRAELSLQNSNFYQIVYGTIM